MINNVVLVGRLTRDPELRYTPAGAAVANFTVAVDRNFTNQNGQREADFISCVMWRKSAENFANFTHKGSLVGIEGRIQTRNYENQQGNRVYVTEVVAENFSLLESRSESERYRAQNGNQAQAPQSPSQSTYNQNPYGEPSGATQSFTQGQPEVNPFDQVQGGSNSGVNVADDDLPF
ncbi:single-strand DNA-binding protein [Ligilactobacillus sp. WC1T17]|jgi:single-strand DNA-binding protein|uniref:Single-stranded DNA-binding protein n=1 Tax=Ligilactobacillus ruminis TaxID=1623 RepID=A0ABY1A946_9LACO|nr:single-strand DNA-binding protein [Ligilactobacillus ruminis]